MASEISWRHTATGDTLYVTIRNAARLYWYTVTPALEALTVAHWSSYDISLSESPASSYFYVGDWPSSLVTPNWYYVDIFKQIGGGQAIGDTLVATIFGWWDGTTFKPMADDAVALGGTTQTGRDIGASVLVSSGAGAGQLDVTGGVVKANLAQILGTALTETAGQIAAAFKKLFNVATPTAQADNLPLNADYTAARAAKLDNLDATISSRSTFAGGAVASVTGSVGSVVGLTPGNLDIAVSSRAAPGDAMALVNNAITAAKMATDAITAAQLAADAIAEIQNGLSTLNAAGVRTAIGMASANLDSQIATLATASALSNIQLDTDDIQLSLSRVVGLLGKFSRVDNPTYDTDNNILTYDIKIYDTAVHAQSGSGTGLLYQYSVVNTYSGGRLATSITTQVS